MFVFLKILLSILLKNALKGNSLRIFHLFFLTHFVNKYHTHNKRNTTYSCCESCTYFTSLFMKEEQAIIYLDPSLVFESTTYLDQQSHTDEVPTISSKTFVGLPIALQKGKRPCTRCPISSFVSYQFILPLHKTFVT